MVGERWALLIVRELALGNSRFEDIVRGTGAPRDRVAARIKALEEAGVIQRMPVSGGATAVRLPAHGFWPCTAAGVGRVAGLGT